MVSAPGSPSLHSPDRRKSLMSTAATALPAPVHFSSLRMPEEQLLAIKNKKVREFYKHQNEMIDRFEQVDRIVDALKRGDDLGMPLYGSFSKSPNSVIDDEESFMSFHGRYVSESENEPLLVNGSKAENSPQWLVRLAINLSFVANIAVFLAKIVLAFFTGSMSILASAFESFLDILSNGIIFFTVLLIRQKDYYAYPVGKSRMEPLGIIVFAVIITTSFSQVLVTSIQRLTDPNKMVEELDLSAASLIVLVANIIVKTVLWIWCLSIKGSSSVQALAQDHENDVVFNIASTVFPVVAMWANWPWLDPVGAIGLSIYIIYEWMIVLVDNIKRLTGRAASPDDIKQLTYMAYRFSRKIQAVDTVRAYYIGDRLLVEVDIVMPPDCPLKEAHDVGEALQDALELMENVERAFVHLDYNQVHAIEHRTVVDSVGFGQ